MSTVRPGPQARVSEVLAWSMTAFSGRLALATSLSAEDQVLLAEAVRLRDTEGSTLPSVFFLDTGRLHEETHALLARTIERYGVTIDVLFPDAALVEDLVRRQGPNGFRSSVEARKACCGVRKVAQLSRALAGKAAWITGLRREQSTTRTDVRVFENDGLHGGILKINPLADWSWTDVLSRARSLEAPLSPLHDAGFPSIGCAPCTRAIEPGEDPRAGRFWWEAPEHKECGLHSRTLSP